MAEPQDPKPPPDEGNANNDAERPEAGPLAPGSPPAGQDGDDEPVGGRPPPAGQEAARLAVPPEEEAAPWGLDPLIVPAPEEPSLAPPAFAEAATPEAPHAAEPEAPPPAAPLDAEAEAPSDDAELEVAASAPESAAEPEPIVAVAEAVENAGAEVETVAEAEAEAVAPPETTAEAEVLAEAEPILAPPPAELEATEAAAPTLEAADDAPPAAEDRVGEAAETASEQPSEDAGEDILLAAADAVEEAAAAPLAAIDAPKEIEDGLFADLTPPPAEAAEPDQASPPEPAPILVAADPAPEEPDPALFAPEGEPASPEAAEPPIAAPTEPEEEAEEAPALAAMDASASDGPSETETPPEIAPALAEAVGGDGQEEIVVSELTEPSAEAEAAPPALPGIAAAQAALGGIVAKLGRLRAKPPSLKIGPIAPPKIDWETLRATKINFKPRPPSVKRILILSGWLVGAFAAIIVGFFFYVTWDMPSTKSLWTADNSTSFTFVDRRGRVVIREGAESAPPVDLSKLKRYVPEAIIAIEDRRFYDHFGIDVSGLMRAVATNMKAGHVVQGGSTITQQLAKNLFLKNERTFRRKAQEVALALWLESQFSKREILALYMSRVYFGAGAYGIQAAAERYFDKPAKELTLAEAALLAGLVKAPSRLNPAAQDTAAKNRAKIVLDEMLTAGFITSKQRDEALRAPLSISRTNPNGNLGYFRNWIDPQLSQIIGDHRDDFVVETTLDLEAQRTAEQTIDEIITREAQNRRVSQGALLAMDAAGGVTAMVGGLGYGKGAGQSEFNRTTQSLRAPGSSFKYFIYLTAMAKGYTPWMVRVDEPVVIGDWAPGNYEDKYYGAVTLAVAYAKSLNMVAIRLANEVGGAAVIETAHKLGVGKGLANYRSLALGAQGMTLMEMVTGYGAMASGGFRIEPHGIERIRRANGQVLWQRRAKPPERVIDERTLRLMNLMGQGVVQFGTGTRANIQGRSIAGKTGTSNDYRDAWFVGYTPGMVAGVWVGNDDNTEMTKVTGGLLATEIWRVFMQTALRDEPIKELPLPTPEDMPPPAPPQLLPAMPEPPAVNVLGAAPVEQHKLPAPAPARAANVDG